MKFNVSIILFFLFFSSNAQERYLIVETDSIQLFETYLSNTSTNNIFPSFYNNGLLYVSNFNSKNYRLLYSNLTSPSQKIAVGSKFNFGSASVYENEIYFTGSSSNYNSVIYKGIIEGVKVSKIKKLRFCNPLFSYTDPFISANGKQMVLVSSEKNRIHILEFVKNKNNEWEKRSVPFISHPSFEIINPTLYDENTIYFSSNIFEGEITEVVYSKTNEGKIVVSEVHREEGDFNIYVIKRVHDSWGIPQKVNAFNSEFDELGVLFDSEKSGYLTSRRYNSNDNIYYFKLKY